MQENSPMKTLTQIYKLRNLIKKPTCFKNPENPAYIDFILTSGLVSKIHL